MSQSKKTVRTVKTRTRTRKDGKSKGTRKRK